MQKIQNTDLNAFFLHNLFNNTRLFLYAFDKSEIKYNWMLAFIFPTVTTISDQSLYGVLFSE